MANGTYVYCVIADSRVPAVGRRVPAGLPGTGPVRLLDLTDEDSTRPAGGPRRRTSGRPLKKWLVVADAPLGRYGEASINRHLSDLDWVARAAVAHEAVVESFINAPAVLPMKLFTIFISDARALDHLRGDRRRVNHLVDRVAGHHEWGVRLALDADHLPARASRAVRGRSAPSGVAYLSLKKAQRDRAAELVQHARATVARLYDRLEAQAAAARRRTASELPVKAGPLLLDAAFLVPRGRSKRFRALVARESKALARQGYRVTMSGPWPPYTFIQD